MKVGIAGVGFMGSTHAAGWAKTNAEIVGFAAETKKEAQLLADQHGARAYPYFESLLADVDVIDICTPTHLHYDMVMQAAAQGNDGGLDPWFPTAGLLFVPLCHRILPVFGTIWSISHVVAVVQLRSCPPFMMTDSNSACGTMVSTAWRMNSTPGCASGSSPVAWPSMSCRSMNGRLRPTPAER